MSLFSAADVQTSLQEWLIAQRKAQKLSRDKLAEISTVPSSTIKKFETTGQISFRQFLLLWQSVDNLERLKSLTETSANKNQKPRSIEEVLKG
jgi:transcriptional regulator with XRE-family HTH domain